MSDRDHMRAAAKAAASSTDRSRKCGCVIITARGLAAYGWNGIGVMHGVEDKPERHERPEKYFWAEHAERRAVYEAARFGWSLEGATLYVTWFPCMDCARAVVECRMKALVYGQEPDLSDPQWGTAFTHVRSLLAEAGIEMRCEPCDTLP